MTRWIYCFDGTWGSQTDPTGETNIAKMARIFKEDTANPQVVRYIRGVGTNGRVDSILGGSTGHGLDQNIIDAYHDLAINYKTGDEIYITGYSRGAYSARSFVGLLRNCGILIKDHADKVGEAYKLYRERGEDSHPNGTRATAFRQGYAREASINGLFVYDTVGALGIPGSANEQHQFHDTRLSHIVKFARHAIAADEHRSEFHFTPWQASQETDSEQHWFAGVHSDVGGGNKEHGASDLALEWMIREAEKVGLEFDLSHYPEYSPKTDGVLHNSYQGMMKIFGSHRRHVCDKSDNPHDYTPMHSWWRDAKVITTDKQESRSFSNWFGFWPSKTAHCKQTDMVIDASVKTRQAADPTYQPGLPPRVTTENTEESSWSFLPSW